MPALSWPRWWEGRSGGTGQRWTAWACRGGQVMSCSNGKKPQGTSPSGREHLHFLTLTQTEFLSYGDGEFRLVMLVSMTMPTGLALMTPSESKSRNVMSGATASTPAPLSVHLADELVDTQRGPRLRSS